MRVVCFVNRRLGARIAEDLLTRHGLDLVAVVTNDPPHVDLDCGTRLTHVPVMCWSDYLTSFSSLPADRGVSVLFRHRLLTDILATFPVVNLHPSLLPWGRGSHPATWAIWESTPFGGTAHLMTETIDTGPILAQRVVPVESEDTSASLYSKGLDALWDIYQTDVVSWLLRGAVGLRDQTGGGSWHASKDLKKLADLDRAGLTAEDRERLARALDMEPANSEAGTREEA